MIFTSLLIAKSTMKKSPSDQEKAVAAKTAAELKKSLDEPSPPGHDKAVTTLNRIRSLNQPGKEKEQSQAMER